MTSPTGGGNTNPGFIFDDGSSHTGGTGGEQNGTQRPGGVRGLASSIYDWFQGGSSSGGNATSQTGGSSTPNPPIITSQPGPSGGVATSVNIQALLGLLTQGGGTPVSSPVLTQPPTVQLAPVPTPATDHNNMQALLTLLAQASGGTIPQPPTSVQTSPTPTPGTNPGVQALLTLLTQVSGETAPIPTPVPAPTPSITTQPIPGVNPTQHAIQALLGLFTQSPGGVSSQGSQLLLSLLQGIATTPGPYQQGAQSILSLLRGQNGVALQQGLGALASLVSGQGSTLSNVGTAVQALSGLAGLAGPVGTAVGSLASIIAAAATSESAQRGGRFCYDNCHTCCEGNCCCPRCGCNDGQCGCGSLGRCLCGLFGNCCGVQVDARRNLERELQEIEDMFGDTIFLMALSRLGIDTVGLLSGSTAITLPPMKRIREECRNCSRELPEILKNKTNAMWAASAQDYQKILNSTFLRGAFVSGMASVCDIDIKQIEQCVRILHQWGGDRGVMAASHFDMEKIALTLTELTVVSRHQNTPGPLGVITAAAVMQDLGKILIKASHGGRQIWINVSDLMTLVCMILACRGICIVPDSINIEEAKIYNRREIKQLISEIDHRRFMNERVRGPVPYAPPINPYFDLATRCFAEQAERVRRMRNPGDNSRQQLLMNLSSRWMLAAGITPTTPVITQPTGLTVPRATAAGLGVAPPRGGDNQNRRNYDQEGARPRGGNGNDNGGGNAGGMSETQV
ncbi:hypothetical protein O1W69_04095 [Chlamydia sp. 12-01]|uniref:hypothetical protein n=1 Tax=Chlamydia sp. 12-01 TaxID=3002742 RepID=UPI0035D4CE8B